MIRTAVNGRVATLTLDRPERRNAMSRDTLHAIAHQLNRWDVDDSVSVVIIAGEGIAFCAGLDRKEMQAADDAVRNAIYQASREFHRAVAGFGKPLIAAIQGHALGTGFDMAVMCDLRIAAQGASLGHPEARMGGVPVVTPLRHIVGDSWARRLCYDGTTIDADTALRIGLVIDVVAPGDLAARVTAAAEAIALTPVDTLKKTKRLFLASPTPESWIVPEHDEVFEQGHTIFSAVK